MTMPSCRRSCLATATFRQTAQVYSIGIPTLSSTNTTIPATPTLDQFGSSKGKTAYAPNLSPTPGVTNRFQVATYPCRVSSNSKPADQSIADANQARAEWKIYMPLSANIKTTDRINVDGRFYEVLDTDAGRADASFLTLFCRTEK